MLKGKLKFSSYINMLLDDMNKVDFIVAYNAIFDASFIKSEFTRANKILRNKLWIDPYILIKQIDRYKKGKKLKQVADRWGIKLNNSHRALSDARATGELFYLIQKHLNIKNLEELYNKQNKWKKEQNQSYMNYLKGKIFNIN